MQMKHIKNKEIHMDSWVYNWISNLRKVRYQ